MEEQRGSRDEGQHEDGDYAHWHHTTPYQRAGAQRRIFEKGSWGGTFHDDFQPQPGDVALTITEYGRFAGIKALPATAELPDGLADEDAERGDVRRLTAKVIDLLRLSPSTHNPDNMIPPGVRFLWGSFQFEGVVESMEQSLEFFSPEGIPLRASISQVSRSTTAV